MIMRPLWWKVQPKPPIQERAVNLIGPRRRSEVTKWYAGRPGKDSWEEKWENTTVIPCKREVDLEKKPVEVEECSHKVLAWCLITAVIRQHLTGWAKTSQPIFKDPSSSFFETSYIPWIIEYKGTWWGFKKITKIFFLHKECRRSIEEGGVKKGEYRKGGIYLCLDASMNTLEEMAIRRMATSITSELTVTFPRSCQDHLATSTCPFHLTLCSISISQVSMIWGITLSVCLDVSKLLLPWNRSSNTLPLITAAAGKLRPPPRHQQRSRLWNPAIAF